MSVAMNAMPGVAHTRGDRNKARALALTMHLAFVALLIFGVSWQKKPEAPVVADLWSNLPPMAPPKVEVAPPPDPEPPPAPAPKVVPPPAPKVVPVPAPKPEIAIKQKEREKKPEPKAAPKPEPKKVDDKAAREKAAETKRVAEERAEQRRKQQELDKAAEAKAAAERAAAAERNAAEQAARAAAARENQRYIAGIQSKVWARVALPADLQGNPEAEFMVSLLPGGELEGVTMRKSSGNPAYDAAIERAIRQAQPFVVPSGDEFHRSFRRFPMTFRPRG